MASKKRRDFCKAIIENEMRGDDEIEEKQYDKIKR